MSEPCFSDTLELHNRRMAEREEARKDLIDVIARRRYMGDLSPYNRVAEEMIGLARKYAAEDADYLLSIPGISYTPPALQPDPAEHANS